MLSETYPSYFESSMKKCCCANRSVKDPSKPELASAPSTIYPLEPEKPGKFVMLTGKPGIGKSTTALFLAQNFGFKYYEAIYKVAKLNITPASLLFLISI